MLFELKKIIELKKQKGGALLTVMAIVVVMGIATTVYMSKTKIKTGIYSSDIGRLNNKYLSKEADFILNQDNNCAATLADRQVDGSTGPGAVTFRFASELNEGLNIDLWLGNINGVRTRKKFANPDVDGMQNTPNDCSTGGASSSCPDPETSHIFGKIRIESLTLKSSISQSELIDSSGSFDAEIILKGKKMGLGGFSSQIKEIRIPKVVYYSYSDPTGSDPLYTLTGCGFIATGLINGSCNDFGVIPLGVDPANNTNGCIDGTFDDGVDVVAEWRWSCLGSGGGTDASCSAPRSATCVPDGDTVAEGGNVNLCCNNIGIGGFTVPNQTQAICNNSGGAGSNTPGDPCTCGVTAAVAGSCVNYPGVHPAQPASDTGAFPVGCLIGNYNDTADSATHWQWECVGSGGGATASCTAEKLTPGSDGCIGTYDQTYIVGGSCNGGLTDPVAASTNTVGMCMYITGPCFGMAISCNNSSLNSLMTNTCSQATSEATCNGSCSWGTFDWPIAATPARPCSDINTFPNGGYNFMTGQMQPTRQHVCNSNSNCSWSPISNTVTRVCSDFTTIASCSSQAGCAWGATATPPDTNWNVGWWGSCSASCGVGVKTRSVTCPAGYNCPLSAPPNSMACSGSNCGGKVICGELFRQGYMNESIIFADNNYADTNIAPATLSLYQYWAKPIVSIMQKSKLFTQIIKPYGLAWAHHMAYLEGDKKTGNYLGYLLHSNLLPVHDFLAGEKSKIGKDLGKDKPLFNTRDSILFSLLVLFILLIISILMLPLIGSVYFVLKRKKIATKLFGLTMLNGLSLLATMVLVLFV